MFRSFTVDHSIYRFRACSCLLTLAPSVRPFWVVHFFASLGVDRMCMVIFIDFVKWKGLVFVKLLCIIVVRVLILMYSFMYFSWTRIWGMVIIVLQSYWMTEMISQVDEYHKGAKRKTEIPTYSYILPMILRLLRANAEILHIGKKICAIQINFIISAKRCAKDVRHPVDSCES